MLSLLALTAARPLGDPLDDAKLRGAMVCAIVTNLNGQVVYEKNADQRVMPASNEKLFTCAFALAQRGPTYRSQTQFWIDGSSVKIVANGNPELSADQLRQIKTKYRIDPSFRVALKQAYKCDRPSTWQLEDVPNRYAPAAHALTIDKGGFELRGSTKGLVFVPHTPVLNKIAFSLGDGKLGLKYDVLAANLTILGRLPATEQRIDTLSDPDPSQTAIACLTGAKTPSIGELQTVPDGNPTVVIDSPSISTLINDCLQPSDNCIAENLFFMGSKAGTYLEARKSISSWLHNTVGLDETYFRIEDGSGLSRKNQTTVRNISKLLKWSQQQPTAQVWRDALARAGVGTLAKRLKNVDFIGKTGTLDMVSALSGFVKCKDGETRIVSVVLNHYGCSESDAQDIIDRFIENVSK